jgi:asparagine synthase (glutamine-hydrolysing)
MSAIWGVIHTDCKAVSKDINEAMIKRLSIYKLDSIKSWDIDNVLLGCGMQYITPESLNEVLPYYDENKGLAITADAIIDNREELFSLLQIETDTNRCITDSEIILKAFEKWGKECPKYLVGDFAFAIWDEKNKELFCARDHIGKRTFYYYYNNNVFILCTVINPIIEALSTKPELNEKWIVNFLALPLTVHELECNETIYSNIHQLPPACTITLQGEQVSINRYWDPLKEVKPLKLKSDKEYEDAFRKVFFEAVYCRLRCNSEVGVMLSGGLDSGSVACIAAKYLNDKNKRLKTFSSVPMISYKDNLPSYQIADESEYIESIGNYHKNIDIKYCRCEGKNSLSNIEFIINVFEQPHKIIENLFWYDEIIEEASKSGCKVLLNGQIGNMTVSYGDFLTHIITLYKKGKVLKIIKEIDGYSSLYKLPKAKVRKIVFRAMLPYSLRKFVSGKVNKPYDKFAMTPLNKELLNKWNIERRFNEKGYHIHPKRFVDIKGMHTHMVNPVAFSQIASVETKFSLAHGIVERDPTSDKRVVEFCLSLPSDQFVRNGQERYIIRRAMKGVLPDKVRLNTCARGFQSADWIQRLQPHWKDIYIQLEKMLEDKNIYKYIDVDRLKKELESLRDGIQEANGRTIRMLLVALIFSRFNEVYNKQVF